MKRMLVRDVCLEDVYGGYIGITLTKGTIVDVEEYFIKDTFVIKKYDAVIHKEHIRGIPTQSELINYLNYMDEAAEFGYILEFEEY